MRDRRCDKCSASVPDGAKFCPQCADPVTDAGLPIDEAATMTVTSELGTEGVRVICPKCSHQDIYAIHLGRGRQGVTCSKCSLSFQTHVAFVRSRRSSASKKENRRKFTIRLRNFDGSEDVVEFINAGTEDFELRAKDVVVFSYLNGQLKILQNLKIGRHLVISKPSCFVATCVYGPHSDEVQILRRWRDERLETHKVGVGLVGAYYALSRPLVGFLGNSHAARTAARILLAPLLWSLRQWWFPATTRGAVVGRIGEEASRRVKG
jgi:hypothetical protein